MSTLDPAVLAERRRMQAQIRAIGLQQEADITYSRTGGSSKENLHPVIDELSPLEIRNALVRFRDVEFRDASGTGDGSYTLAGYAAVYDQETVLYDGSWWRLREVVAPGAFDNVLATNPDVHLNIGHDMTRAIARTGVDGIGGLELSSDKEGLRVFARLDPQDPDVVSLAAKMNRGIVDQMSFAFTIARAKYESEIDDENDFEDELRTILEIGQLYDTAVCAQGAYPQTSAELAMRTLTGALGRAIPDLAGLLEHRDPESGAPEPTPAVQSRAKADAAFEEALAQYDEAARARWTSVNVTIDAVSADDEADDDDAEQESDTERARKAQATAMRMRVVVDD